VELNGAALVRVPAVLDRHTVRDLRAVLEAAILDPQSRVAVLLGPGEGVFCRGMDLAGSQSPEGLGEAVDDFAACLEIIRLGRKPVLAFVHGQAVGGGVGLAAACDGVLATDDSSFTLSELLFGLTPAIILPYLAQRVSAQRLRWMALTSLPVTAGEAVALGLIERTCRVDDAGAILRAWIDRLRRLDPTVVESWKRASANPPSPGSPDGTAATLERLRDAGVRQRLQRFLETGEPPWLVPER
jgi:enoyl-CoA hydratase/carnithine racemase